MMAGIIDFARNNTRTRVLIGNDGPYILHPWWERGLRAQVKILAAKRNIHGAGKSMTVSNSILAAAKPTKIVEQEKQNA